MRCRLAIIGNDLVCTVDGAMDARVPLTDPTLARMDGWAAQYKRAVERDDAGALVDVGRAMLESLQTGGWVAQWVRGTGDRVLEIAVDDDESRAARVVLDLPWELLADSGGLLAADATQPFVVVRSLGRAADDVPAQPMHRDLAVMFTAASPQGQQRLDFEAEETAILAATDRLPVQVAVEESGCAAFLKERLADEGPFEAVHVSCHGGLHEGIPRLALETPVGELAPLTPGEFASTLGEVKPPLVFVSACRTADSSGGFTEPFRSLSSRMRRCRREISERQPVRRWAC